MRSILGPLTLGLALSLCAVFAAQWSIARFAIERMMEEHVVAELDQDVDELSNGLVVNAEGEFLFSINHFDPVFLREASGRYFQISADGGRPLLSVSLGSFALHAAAPTHGRHETFRQDGPGKQQLLVRAGGAERGGHHFTIAVAADMLPVRERIDGFLLLYTLLTLILFAVLVALQIWIVRRSLAPLQGAQNDVARLERGDIAQLGEASVPAEVLPLVRGINRLLTMLAERLRRSRESLGNLSHALKTPLTLLTQISEHDAIRGDPALRTQMQQQLRVLGDNIDRELRRARIAGGHAQGEAVDLVAEIDLLVMTMRKLHRDRELAIETVLVPAPGLRCDREDLLELCGNLLDNACKWARHRVRISVDGSEGLRLAVEDDGPGCADDDLAKLAERGVRLDETTAGHGLGLAIVRNLVSGYGGELHFGRSPDLGGFRVSVLLGPGGGFRPAS